MAWHRDHLGDRSVPDVYLVALALRGWLPPTRSVRLATAAAVGAMVATAILQLLLVAGVLEFGRSGAAGRGDVPRGLHLGAHRQLGWPPPRYTAPGR